MAYQDWECASLQLNIIIVGGGLGGLAAAIQCRLAGHKVLILEQAAEMGEVGAGIQIPPQSARLLKGWGLEDRLKEWAVEPRAHILRSYKDGKPLSVSPLNDYVQKKYDSPYWLVHRADFHRALLEKATSLGVQVRLNSHVQNIDFEAPSVTIADGNKIEGHIVVGCDGLKSRIRELMVGHPDPPVNTGDVAYRILVPASKMREHKELHVLLEGGQKTALNIWMGPDCHVVCYMLKGGDLFNIVLLCPDDLPDKVAVQAGDLEEMRGIFKSWDPRLKTLLSLVDKPPIKWKLQNHEELATWTHTSGKVTLLGDSCHPTLPYLGSGAAIAVEDGAALGLLLAKVSTYDDIRPILQTYEKMRKFRTTIVVQRSTHYRSVFHCHDGPEQEDRDKRFEMEDPPQIGYPNQWADPVFQKWLWGYRVEDEVERAWADLSVTMDAVSRSIQRFSKL